MRNLGGFFMPAVWGIAMADRYKKRPITFQEQLVQLEERGLQIQDRQAALTSLASISYYRLSAYWYPFRLRGADGAVTNQLEDGTTFEDVIDLYDFDRRLRLLIMDAIERVEVAVRTRLTYHLAHRYGAFAHTDRHNFHPGFNHSEWLAKLEAETVRSSDEFIRHYRSKYDGFPTIPIWMLTEVMSLGSLSLLYKGLNNNKKSGVEDKKSIADHFNVHHKRLVSWLHTLTYIRNVCAHHSRLWNRELAIRPDASKDVRWQPPITPRNDRIFYVLLILRHMLHPTANGDDWHAAVCRLIEPYARNVHYRAAMGLPVNWRDHPIWM